jgi:uncharacterized protein YecT (DUF1311 family)
MRKRFAVAVCVSACVLAAPPREPIDEVVVAKLVKRGMSEAQVRTNFDACDSGGPISMKVCFRYRLEGEEMRVDRIFKLLKKKVPTEFGDGALKWLGESESAWQLFRDTHCNLEGATTTFDSGVAVLACEWQMTRQRGDELQKFADRFNE